jgi:hypothetical protein
MASLSKSVVLASTLAAAYIELYLATTPLYPSMFWFALAAAIGMAAIGRRAHTAGLPIAMFAMYLTPAALLSWIGRGGEHFSLEMIWILPLLGMITSGRGALQWSLPRKWQWALVTWALIVALSWPIIYLRELDFSPWILWLDGIANSSRGIPPLAAGLNVSYFALGHLVGILWIDALFRWFAGRRVFFINQVAWPLAGAAAVASAVALYQGFVDLRFLNTNFWAYMLRASGTLGDPNKLGMIAAFWAMGSVVLGRSLRSPWSWVVAVGGLFLAVAAVWITGTRTGLAAVIISGAFLLAQLVRDWRSQDRASTWTGSMTKPAIGVVLLAAVLVGALTQAGTHTVIGRGVLTLLPYGEVGVQKGFNRLLWERDGYGPAAIQMVREHPVAGVGTGAFHTVVHDYGTVVGYDIVPDNAQAWVRHLLAELGLSGAVAWVTWCVVFGALLFSRVRGGDAFTIRVLRGVLLGFAAASLFGMAGQSMPVILTFWVFVFWFATSKDESIDRADSHTWSRRAKIATVLLVIVSVGATALAANELRPANRAKRFGWPFSYGLRSVEPGPDGVTLRRWTLREAVVVIPVEGKVLKFVAWIDHPDADQRPVPVRVWADSKLVYSGELKRSAAIFLDIPATPGEQRMLLETTIDRLWRPTDFGRSDQRELGLSIRDWTWE